MGPEIIKRSYYDYKADIWSLGITIIELATGNPPFADMDPRRALFLIPRTKPPRLEGSFSPAIKEFISLCLKEEPEDRPSAKELLDTKFVKSASSPSIMQELIKRHKIWKDSQDQRGQDEEEEELENIPDVEFDTEWQFNTSTIRPVYHKNIPTNIDTASYDIIYNFPTRDRSDEAPVLGPIPPQRGAASSSSSSQPTISIQEATVRIQDNTVIRLEEPKDSGVPVQESTIRERPSLFESHLLNPKPKTSAPRLNTATSADRVLLQTVEGSVRPLDVVGLRGRGKIERELKDRLEYGRELVDELIQMVEEMETWG